MDIHDYIKGYVHSHIREMLGDTLYALLSVVSVLAGTALLLIAISDSNIILGNPAYRNRSSLNELQYRKTRQQLRIALGAVGVFLILYNILGFV